MRRQWDGLRWLIIGVLFAAGCWTTEQSIKPPRRPEEFKLPQDNDPRYRAPPGVADMNPYPKGTLNSDLAKRDSKGPVNPLKAPTNLGGAGRSGGLGGY